MRRAVREFGQTIVMVTHDPNAAAYADRVVFLADGRIVDEMATPTGRAGPRPHEAVRGLTMSVRSTALIARRASAPASGVSSPSRIAILLGVSFVVGSFVLADSLRQTFDNLFTQISQNVDLEVRATVAFGEDDVNVQREPVPASLGDAIAPVEGVAGARRPQRYAQLLDPDGEAIATQGAPTLGRLVDGDNRPLGRRNQGRVAARQGPTKSRSTRPPPTGSGYEVGDQIQVITDTGTGTFTIIALVGLGDTDGFAGATLAAWDVATAQQVFGMPRSVRRDRRPGATRRRCQRRSTRRSKRSCRPAPRS